jgi:putative transposase
MAKKKEFLENKNWIKTYLPSSTFSLPKIMNNPEEKEEKKKEMKTRKYRIYPNQKQVKTLKKWFGVARWTYNQCVAAIKNKECVVAKTALSSQYMKEALRSKYINNANFNTPEKEWVTKVPYDIRDEAMRDVLKAIDSNTAKQEKNSNHHFELHFRSRKSSSTESITILKKHWAKKTGVYAKIFKHLKSSKKLSENLPLSLPADSRMIRTRLGQYYLCVPELITVQVKQASGEFNKCVAIDPGVRTFATTYDTEGNVVEWGKEDRKQLFRLAVHMDKLISSAASSETKAKKRCKLKKVILRMRERLRNLVDELHKKLSTWLCRNYEVILIPEFRSSGMIGKHNRRLTSKVVRQMLTWSHYRFRQRLVHKSREFAGVSVVFTSEAYTSQTCGCCGQLHTALGLRKEFQCPHCGYAIDRDINGARNIMIRYLSNNNNNDLLSL